MRISRFLNVAVLSTLVTMSGALYAQDEKPQDPKPPRQEEPRAEPKQDDMKAPKQEKQDQAKPAQQDNQNQMKPAQQGDMKPEKPQQEKQEEAKPSKEEQKAQKDQQKQQEKEQKDQMKHNQQGPAAQTGNNARPAAQGNAGAVGHPKGKSARIPDDRFRSNFGRSHTFVVQRTTVVQGQPGFVSGGVNFIFLDPWPADWAYTDDCYVDYIDGEYFLFDLLHPGIRIALFVAL